MEAVAFQVGGPGLFDGRGDKGGSMSITTQPAEVPPAITSHGNPAAAPSISVHACARALARARAIGSSMAGVPARSSARRTVGPLGAAPSTGVRWASRPMSLMLVAPSAITAAIETSTIPRSSRGEVPFLRSAALRPAVSPAWSAALRRISRRRGRPGPSRPR